MLQPTITLCMIVKNEETLIARCLDSVAGLVDEMIIVDTGSTDQTAAICQTYGAAVLPFEWADNFAEARNYGLSRATGTWILYLDADEELAVTDDLDVKTFLSETDAAILNVELINFISETPKDDEAYQIGHPRFFRNHLGLKFKYPIHETLNVDEIASHLTHAPLIKSIPVKVRHYGYMESVAARKNKFERNISLLRKELDDQSPNLWVEYHLAGEYYRIRDYEKAFEYVNKSIVRFLQENILPPSLLYKLKYAVLLQSGNVDGAWPGIEKAIQLYPDYVDLHFYKGVILYLRKQYAEAIEAFRHSLSLGEPVSSHLVLRGVGSFHAWYYIGLCREAVGDTQLAVDAYTTALELFPSYREAIDALSRIGSANESK